MKNQEKEPSEEECLLQRGFDPEMVDNLKQSQASLAKLGMKLTLQEVYDLEVEQVEEQ